MFCDAKGCNEIAEYLRGIFKMWVANTNTRKEETGQYPWWQSNIDTTNEDLDLVKLKDYFEKFMQRGLYKPRKRNVLK